MPRRYEREQALVDAGLMRKPWDGRGGSRWRRLRAQVLGASTICGICGHDGADTVDHIIARVERPDLAEDINNLQPAHGVNGCPTCRRRCQVEKGSNRTSDLLQTTEDWFA